MKKFFKSFIFLPLILIAAVAFVVMQVKSKKPVEHEELQFPVKVVEVITIDKIPFRSRAMAFGNVEPKVVLNAKSEVSGKVSYIHPDLKKGASLKKGTVVLRIEPTTFEISLDSSKAGLAGSRSSLKQLKTEEQSSKRSLQIAQKNLNLGQAELKRVKILVTKGTLARNQIDIEEQKVLQLRSTVQDLQGKLNTYASKKASTRAQITQSKSQVDQSKDTLGRTEVKIPFDARIGVVSIEKGEFISVGGLLFEALGVQAVEIDAQLPVKQFRPLTSSLALKKGTISLKDPASLQIALTKMNLEARVRLVGDSSIAAVWEGKLTRLSESVDPTRDTLGLVISVDKPYEGIIPGQRPPLLKGMYTSVELFSPAKPTLVVPRKAVHQSRVYIANEKNTLEIQPVNILFQQGDMVVLDGEKDSSLIGKKIIISDVIPIMEGLPLKVIETDEYQKQLALNALGESE